MVTSVWVFVFFGSEVEQLITFVGLAVSIFWCLEINTHTPTHTLLLLESCPWQDFPSDRWDHLWVRPSFCLPVELNLAPASRSRHPSQHSSLQRRPVTRYTPGEGNTHAQLHPGKLIFTHTLDSKCREPQTSSFLNLCVWFLPLSSEESLSSPAGFNTQYFPVFCFPFFFFFHFCTTQITFSCN